MKKFAIILSLLYVGSFTYPVLFILCEINYNIYVALGRPFMLGQADGIMAGMFSSFSSLAVIMAVMAIVFRKKLFGGSVKEKICNAVICLVNFIVMYFSVAIPLNTNYPNLIYVVPVVVAVTVFFTLKTILGFKLTKKEEIAE